MKIIDQIIHEDFEDSEKIDAFIHNTKIKLIKSVNADVFENKHQYVIQIELPGVNKDSLKIIRPYADNMIVVSGEIKCPDTKIFEGEGIKYHLKERSCGIFYRTFTLNGIKDSNPRLSFDSIFVDGVLEIRIPKE
jgi:HSP20 family protein